MPFQNNDLLTLAEAAEILRVSTSTILDMIDDGRLSYVDLSRGENAARRLLRIRYSDLMAFKEQAVGSNR